jgi:hypothetical protein
MATTAIEKDPNESVALAPMPSPGMRLLRPVAAPAQMIEAQNATRDYIEQVLEEGKDYGKVPGVSKPTLLKPGAEKVTLGFGCAAAPRILEQEIDHDRAVHWVKQKKRWLNRHAKDREFVWDKEEGASLGLYRYVVQVDVVDQDGAVRGSGIGSCSSMESKYVDRPRDCENTILKMATKRAHVAAVLSTFGLSEQFTQDAEESPIAAGQEERAAAPIVSPRDTPWPAWPGFDWAGKRFREIPEDVLIEQRAKAKGRAEKATVAAEPSKARLAQNLVDACEAELEARRLEAPAQPSVAPTAESTTEPEAEPALVPASRAATEERHPALDVDEDDGLPF